MPLCLLRGPQLHFNAYVETDFSVALQLFPTFAAAEQERAVLLELNRFGPVFRKIANKVRALSSQLVKRQVRHALAYHGGVASGRVKTRNSFLLQQQNPAGAAPA